MDEQLQYKNAESSTIFNEDTCTTLLLFLLCARV